MPSTPIVREVHFGNVALESESLASLEEKYFALSKATNNAFILLNNYSNKWDVDSLQD